MNAAKSFARINFQLFQRSYSLDSSHFESNSKASTYRLYVNHHASGTRSKTAKLAEQAAVKPVDQNGDCDTQKLNVAMTR